MRMRRRELLFAGVAALLTQRQARAAEVSSPKVGFLGPASPKPYAHILTAFHEGLAAKGFAEGQNVAIEYRWAHDQYDQLPRLAAELVKEGVAVIFTASGTQTAQAAIAATSTIPIVFVVGTDPVKFKLVSSITHPSANATGMSLLTTAMARKRLDVLRLMVPSAKTFALLLNPKNPNFNYLRDDVSEAALALGVQIFVLSVSKEEDFDTAFEQVIERHIDGLVVSDDPIFVSRRDKLVFLTLQNKIPAIYSNREVVLAGGLIGYGASYADTFRRAGMYVGEILKGAKPKDLPVMQPEKFELTINLKTAGALGLRVPPELMILADEVIE
jgi:putative tryptophan/tyrosine transport system substrate-binding protein